MRLNAWMCFKKDSSEPVFACFRYLCKGHFQNCVFGKQIYQFIQVSLVNFTLSMVMLYPFCHFCPPTSTFVLFPFSPSTSTFFPLFKSWLASFFLAENIMYRYIQGFTIKNMFKKILLGIMFSKLENIIYHHSFTQ